MARTFAKRRRQYIWQDDPDLEERARKPVAAHMRRHGEVPDGMGVRVPMMLCDSSKPPIHWAAPMRIADSRPPDFDWSQLHKPGYRTPQLVADAGRWLDAGGATYGAEVGGVNEAGGGQVCEGDDDDVLEAEKARANATAGSTIIPDARAERIRRMGDAWKNPPNGSQSRADARSVGAALPRQAEGRQRDGTPINDKEAAHAEKCRRLENAWRAT